MLFVLMLAVHVALLSLAMLGGTLTPSIITKHTPIRASPNNRTWIVCGFSTTISLRKQSLC